MSFQMSKKKNQPALQFWLGRRQFKSRRLVAKAGVFVAAIAERFVVGLPAAAKGNHRPPGNVINHSTWIADGEFSFYSKRTVFVDGYFSWQVFLLFHHSEFSIFSLASAKSF